MRVAQLPVRIALVLNGIAMIVLYPLFMLVSPGWSTRQCDARPDLAGGAGVSRLVRTATRPLEVTWTCCGTTSKRN